MRFADIIVGARCGSKEIVSEPFKAPSGRDGSKESWFVRVKCLLCGEEAVIMTSSLVDISRPCKACVIYEYVPNSRQERLAEARRWREEKAFRDSCQFALGMSFAEYCGDNDW